MPVTPDLIRDPGWLAQAAGYACWSDSWPSTRTADAVPWIPAYAGMTACVCASRTHGGTVMFARESSTRGQMKSPSIAQRGEGGARGGSGESVLLSLRKPRKQRDADK